MKKSAANYLLESAYILRANISYVIIPVILVIFPFLTMHMFVNKQIAFIIASWIWIFIIIILPLFYGQFIEIIKFGKKDKWINIFNNYWPKFFLTILILRGPPTLLKIFASKLYVFNNIFSFIISIASIYILPLVLLNKEILRSIDLGIKCLLGNLKFSLPLIIAMICLFLSPFLLILASNYINSPFLTTSLSIVDVFFRRIIEFSVFIAAGLILKDKLLSS